MRGGIILKEFIDKTSEQNGTEINREAMMALQGFQAKTTKIESYYDDEEGKWLGKMVTEVNGEGHTLTTVIMKRKIIETFVGEKTITKTTTFPTSYTMSEVIS